MNRCALRTAVVRGDAKDDRVGVLLGDLDLDVEVAAVVEDAGVDQLELGIGEAAPPVLFDEAGVGILPLRILVEHPLVGVTGQGIEVEVALLHVFAVVAFGRNQAEEALLQNRVAFVPERQRPAEDLVAIAESADAVLAPAERFGASLVVREVAPGIAIRAVVLADGTPGAVGEVGSPAPPARELVSVTRESRVLGIDLLHRTGTSLTKSSVLGPRSSDSSTLVTEDRGP